MVSLQCLSPFDRLIGKKVQVAFASGHPSQLGPVEVGRLAACAAATDGREHAVDALGIAAAMLVGLSFLPRRRASARQPAPSSASVIAA